MIITKDSKPVNGTGLAIKGSDLTTEEREFFKENFGFKMKTWPWEYSCLLSGKTMSELMACHRSQITFE